MSSIVSLQNDVPSENWLASRRSRARSVWTPALLPTRKTESWRYTRLSAMAEKGLFSAPLNTDKAAADSLVPKLNGGQSLSLVFVNGQLDTAQSDLDAMNELKGLSVCLFSQASESQSAFIDAKLGTLVDSEQHPFSVLNESQLYDGLLIHVDKKADVQPIIDLVFTTTPGQSDFTVMPRVLVALEPGSHAAVLEHYVSDNTAQSVFVNAVTECFVAENAHLHHYRLHTEHESAYHIGGVHVALDRSATLNSFHFALGSQVKRIDLVVHHRGEGGDAQINGIYLPSAAQHIDYHTCIEHAVPHCSSNEVFRGIIGDRAKAVFNGRIHIHKDAQKTMAQLSNKNLLTSDKAEIDTKPELEIYADDVQCAHGATVAQLDLGSMHYLRSRGISAVDAEVLLSFGFINELIDGIQHDTIAEFLRNLVRDKFTRESSLVSHQV